MAVAWLMLVAGLSPARADTVATLLGNFTINQFCGVNVDSDRAKIHFVVVFGQLPALTELHAADANGDGVTTPAERDAYLSRLAQNYAGHLKLTVDGVLIPLHAERLSSSLPTEQAGFSLRFDGYFVGPITSLDTARRVDFSNDNYPGRIGWHEIQVSGQDGVFVYDANAFADSLTEGLSVNPKALPTNGPLDERQAQFSFTTGPVPSGAVPLGRRGSDARASMAPRVVPDAGQNSNANWLEVRTKEVLSLVSAPTVPLQVKLLALLGALVLGALHAFSPGHGKTVVGAYLIGSRGTPKHALFLGLIVTVTHTMGVFLLGFATLFAASYIVPERLFPIISLLSGLLVVGIGGTLLVQRVSSMRRRSQPLQFTRIAGQANVSLALAPTHHDHVSADGTLVHSHGGSTHSHLPAVESDGRITWRSLFALGVSGGLIPCPSAMVLLLAAVALNKTALGLLLVVAFSVGLAATLTVVGLVFLYARRLFPRLDGDGLWAQRLPIASAALITLVGLAICVNALLGGSAGL